MDGDADKKGELSTEKLLMLRSPLILSEWILVPFHK